MKVLLIYPQYIHSSEFDVRAPAMSLVYLAATLERNRHQVTIYDASLGPIRKTGRVFRYGYSDEEVHRFLRTQEFDIVGITCSFVSRWRFVAKIAQHVKDIYPNALVAVGGLFPTYSWQYCLNYSGTVDIVMLGEAELNFAQIVNSLSQRKSIGDSCKNIEGVAWKENGRIFLNPKVSYNNILDDLAFPAWHLLDLKNHFSLQKSIFELKVPCLPILSSRSCPNRCRFCNMYITHGSRWRARSAKNVLAEIEYLINRFDVHNFYFIDDNFSVDLNRAKDICRGILECRLGIKYNFHNGLSIKAIDAELVELMKKSGCTSVCLAIESGSERVRNEIYGKSLSTAKIIEVFELFRKAKIPIIGYFMIGTPGEKRIDFEESKRLMIKLPLTLVTAGIYMPYPQTELYDECKNRGWLLEKTADDEERVEIFSPMLKTPDFSPEDIMHWQKELYLSFIKHHWPTLIKEALRPGGVVNFDMIGKFIGMLKFGNGGF